ncbi:hypothetical protein FO519_005243 [Halicephalobus sp. NKZ332]|nr:hypothetical protein FO519_005243 [Halicephalobus sp. NKZ332]
MTSGDKLLQIQTVFRHGARAPEGTYKNDPYQEDTWPWGWAELTTLGMQQQFDQGTKMRERYIDQLKFMPTKYTNDVIYARSSSVNRALMSALSNLAGFYTESQGTYPQNPQWPKTWSPVPVHTADHGTDYVLNAHANCPRAKELEDLQLTDGKFLEYALSLMPYLEIVANHTGDPPNDFHSLGNTFDALNIEKLHNLTLPLWVTDDLYSTLENFTYHLIDFMNGSPDFGKNEVTELIMLQGGVLLNEMIQNMEKSIKNNGTGTKFHMYSGHDTGIAAHLRAFGAKEGAIGRETPQMSSMSVVELWDGDGKPYIKLLYSDNSTVPFRDVTKSIGDCGSGDKCDFQTFKERSQKYIATPEDIVQKCNNIFG